MARNKNPPLSIAEAKDLPFGELVYNAIIAEFDTVTNFVRYHGKTAGNISQIYNGQADPKPATVKQVLRSIKHPGWQEAIENAYMRDFVRPSVESSWNGNLDQFIQQIRGVDQAGNPARALQFAMAGRNAAKGAHAWQELTLEAFQINLRLTRTGSALGLLDEMRNFARSDSESVATHLWMRGIALRNIEGVTVDVVERGYAETMARIRAARPRTPDEHATLIDRETAVERDRALDILAVHNRTPVPRKLLTAGLQSVIRSMHQGDTEAIYFTGLEVRARVEIALDQISDAELHLAEVEEQGAKKGTDLADKLAITKAKILIAKGQKDEAVFRLERAADRAFNAMNLHHHRTADQLLARLRAGL